MFYFDTAAHFQENGALDQVLQKVYQFSEFWRRMIHARKHGKLFEIAAT